MNEKRKALLLAALTMLTLSSCTRKDKLDKSALNKRIIDSTSISLPDFKKLYEEAKENISKENTEEVQYEPCSMRLESPEIAGEIAKIEEGIPFRFTYASESHEIHSHFDFIGPLFKQIKKDGIKYLVDAEDEQKVYVSGYDFLGMPYYLKGYDQKMGGTDPESKLSGWVIPIYNYCDRDSGEAYQAYHGLIPNYTFDLYDFESFKPIMKDITEDVYYESVGFMGATGPVESSYYPVYDPAYGGKDKNNAGAGLLIEVTKWGKKYLIDVNDLKTIIYENYSSCESFVDDYDENPTLYVYGNHESKTLTPEDIKLTTSNILMRELKKH